jgi:hypothetical protein
MAIGLYGYMAMALYGIYLKWHHSRTECKSCFVVLLLLGVFEGTTDHVPRMATCGNPRLDHRVGRPTGGAYQHRQDPTN